MMVKKNNLSWLFWLIGLVIVNIIAANLHRRFDLTEEKRYSVSADTRQLIRQADELQITLFLTGELPAEFRRLSTVAQDFVSELREANPSKISYRTVDPLSEVSDGKLWADSLKTLGASAINLNVQLKAGEETKLVYPYAVVQRGEQLALVNLFQSSKRNISIAELNNAEAMLEYQFARAIDQLTSNARPGVAYAVGNDEPTNAQVFDLQQTIASHYKFGTFNLATQRSIPTEIDVLLIVKPASPFSDAEKLKLDQYVMNGGKVIWFIDNLHAEQDSLSLKSQLIAYERGLNIEDLLFNYGVRINPDLIMDLQCDFLPFMVGGSRTEPQYEFLHWNYYPLFETRGNHMINKNLGLVAGRYVNSIDTIERPGVKKTFLLQSSENSRVISTPALISPNENRNTPQDVLFSRKAIPAAVLLEGKFQSLYKNRISRSQLDTLNQFGGFKEESMDNKMIVVADGDLVLNDVSPRQGPLPMGLNLFTAGSQYEFQFANRDFLLNCLEYLISKTSIISTRNKEVVLRMLDVRRVDAERTRWQLINIVLPIIVILLFALIYLEVRRRAFTT